MSYAINIVLTWSCEGEYWERTWYSLHITTREAVFSMTPNFPRWEHGNNKKSWLHRTWKQGLQHTVTISNIACDCSVLYCHSIGKIMFNIRKNSRKLIEAKNLTHCFWKINWNNLVYEGIANTVTRSHCLNTRDLILACEKQKELSIKKKNTIACESHRLLGIQNFNGNFHTATTVSHYIPVRDHWVQNISRVGRMIIMHKHWF